MAIHANSTPAPVVQPGLLRRRPEPLLPAPAPLASLPTAFSRRAALFGAVAATGFLGAAAAALLPGTTPTDARLIALADLMEEIDRTARAHVVQHHLRETDETDDEFAAIVSRYGPVESELASTPAVTRAGCVAKARACQVGTLRDVDGGEVALSLADDIVRLHAAGAWS